jgi:hypothetical protein
MERDPVGSRHRLGLSLALVIIERSLQKDWLSNAYPVVDEVGGTAVTIDSRFGVRRGARARTDVPRRAVYGEPAGLKGKVTMANSLERSVPECLPERRSPLLERAS